MHTVQNLNDPFERVHMFASGSQPVIREIQAEITMTDDPC